MAWVDPPTWDADDPWLHTDANQYVTDNTEYLYGLLSSVFVLNKWNTTPVSVNTTSWTNVCTFAVAGGELAGENGYRIVLYFEFSHQVSGNYGFDARLRFGGTTLASFGSSGLDSGQTAYGTIEAILFETAEDTQEAVMVMNWGRASGTEDPAADGGMSSVDSSSGRNLQVDVRTDLDGVNSWFTMKAYHIHKLTAA
jgi:hypothetical protein